MKITARASTFLKKRPIQSSELPDGQKIFVEIGRTYLITKISEEREGHRFVELDYGAGDWWIFSEHWDVDEKADDFSDCLTNVKARKKDEPIDWTDGDRPISRYFTVKEVTKKDPRRIPVRGSAVEKNILALARELDKVREAWGSPIGVTSWYRPVLVNRSVGGARGSLHITGQAVDIYPIAGNLLQFEKWLDARWYGALGYGASANRGFVHIDTRNGKGFESEGTRGVRWNY